MTQMDDIFAFLLETYGRNEPIFTDELKGELSLSPQSFRQAVMKLANTGLIVMVKKGIYFIPREKPLFGTPVLSVEKIVNRKYLVKQGERIGFKTGINFANSLRLTSQTASVPTIITNNTAAKKREVLFYKNRVIIKKPRIQVTEANWKILQVLELMKQFNRLSEVPIEQVKPYLDKYLQDVVMVEAELQSYLAMYPKQTEENLLKSGIYTPSWTL